MDAVNRGKSYKRNEQWQIELSDDYEHIDDNIDYVMENVLQTTNTQSPSYQTLYNNFNAFVAQKCICQNDTAANVCSQANCLHGGNYVIYENEQFNQRELILNEHRRSPDVIYECSEFCDCHRFCLNRLVQFGPRKHLKIADYSHIGKQFGLMTLASIPKGSFICEYAGEILTHEEAFERYRINDANHRMNYIICLNERPIGHEMQTTDATIQTFVDPSRIGNIGRYLNHSCDPNCEIISVRIDGIIPKLCKISVLVAELCCFLISIQFSSELCVLFFFFK